jgi:hypothetical protein
VRVMLMKRVKHAALGRAEWTGKPSVNVGLRSGVQLNIRRLARRTGPHPHSQLRTGMRTGLRGGVRQAGRRVAAEHALERCARTTSLKLKSARMRVQALKLSNARAYRLELHVVLVKQETLNTLTAIVIGPVLRPS